MPLRVCSGQLVAQVLFFGSCDYAMINSSKIVDCTLRNVEKPPKVCNALARTVT